ncbi:MAG: antitoxin Xre-like helix-turn-helix domain-containing protein [Myxococcota bacterium]
MGQPPPPGRLSDRGSALTEFPNGHTLGFKWNHREACVATLSQVVAVLGGSRALGRRMRSARQFTELVRAGLPFAAFEAVMTRYGLTQEVLSATVKLPKSTLARRRRSRRLTPEESDRLYRLARILAHATQVFEDTEAVADWLRSPIVALGKQDPLSLLDTDIGAGQVEQVLGRIEHGVIS